MFRVEAKLGDSWAREMHLQDEKADTDTYLMGEMEAAVFVFSVFLTRVRVCHDGEDDPFPKYDFGDHKPTPGPPFPWEYKVCPGPFCPAVKMRPGPGSWITQAHQMPPIT